MRTIRSLVFAAVLAVVPAAQAEVTWIDAGANYELTGAALFKLRGELPPELEESLKAVRNQTFASEDEFLAALEAALLTDDLRADWTERLAALSKGAGAAFGFEPRQGLMTFYVAGDDHALDDNPFTSQSWLKLPAEVSATGLDIAEDGKCISVSQGNARLLSLCDPEVSESGKTVVLRAEAQRIYGLGQEFQVEGDTIVNRAGFVRHGLNVMEGFNGGANGNTLFPIAYFDRPDHPFALILDNRYQQEWDFSGDEFRLRVWGGDLRLHLLTGDTLAGIRRQYMAMTGHPPIPPKAAFGLWISEYGYDNWAELDDKIATLTASGFPLSGVVMDLQWFGGIAGGSPASRMGSLTWDRLNFPDPEAKIAELAARRIGMMVIEESYIGDALPEYAVLAQRQALAHDSAGMPIVVNPAGSWWGRGGMVDWTSKAGRDFWHDFRRQPLIDMGIAGHWTDLGEPEMLNPDFHYSGSLPHPAVHNSYNLLWLQGIFDGYRRNSPEKRPFIMSRSGGMGMQALGAAMWSGDTGSDFGSLAAQMPQQTHMMWSGLDYYGSDVGGFHRAAFGNYPGSREAAMDELFTQWLAYSALFEVPVRPHTENLCNCKETAPDRIGDLASNLANLKLRYTLLPYYYSLAYRAWRDGEPVFPSLDYAFPDDPAAHGLGHVKMIGSHLLGAAVAAPGATDVAVYLPAGDWYAFRTGERIVSEGETIVAPIYFGDLLELPLFVRDGGVVPTADGTLSIFGTAPNRFDWYDDDGVSTAYKQGDFELVRVFVKADGLELSRGVGISLTPATLRWVRPDAARVSAVRMNGREIPFAGDGTEISVAIPHFADRLILQLVFD